MLTPDIRQRVRDNLNREDSGIDTKIQAWINDVKRRIEQRLDMDYMRAATELTFVAGDNAETLPTRFKHDVDVQIRKTVPISEREVSWTIIPRIGEAEVLRLKDYDSAGTLVRSDPRGYTLTETELILHPQPEATDTWVLAVAHYAFSADWTFGGAEEPYLAKFAHIALIDGATALGYAWLGQLGDEANWEEKFERKYKEFVEHEVRRALEGDFTLRPRTGMDNRRPSRSEGWVV